MVLSPPACARAICCGLTRFDVRSVRYLEKKHVREELRADLLGHRKSETSERYCEATEIAAANARSVRIIGHEDFLTLPPLPIRVIAGM